MNKTILINGDCLEVAEQIADNSVDLVLTDPPYNISATGPAEVVWLDPETRENKSGIHSQDFSKSFDQPWDAVSHDEFLLQLNDWANLWHKKLRKGGAFVVFISDQYLSHLWHAMASAGLEPKRAWTWKKPAAVPFNRRVNPVSGCEYAIWGIKPGGKRTFNSDAPEGTIVERYALADKASSILYRLMKDAGPHDSIDQIFAKAKVETQRVIDGRKRTNGLIECVIPNTLTFSGGMVKDKIHPTQKPVEIMEYFVELLSNPGDLVLDTFAGSGSTGVACNNRNRKSVLIERDKKMFDLMSDRLIGPLDSLFE